MACGKLCAACVRMFWSISIPYTSHWGIKVLILCKKNPLPQKRSRNDRGSFPVFCCTLRMQLTTSSADAASSSGVPYKALYSKSTIILKNTNHLYLLLDACLSRSRFLVMALLLPLDWDAAMISSASASSIFIFLLNVFQYAPWVIFRSATSTRRCGAISTALGYLAPPYSIEITSSRGAAFSTACTKASTGFFFNFASTLPNALSIILRALFFLPVLCPELM